MPVRYMFVCGSARAVFRKNLIRENPQEYKYSCRAVLCHSACTVDSCDAEKAPDCFVKGRAGGSLCLPLLRTPLLYHTSKPGCFGLQRSNEVRTDARCAKVQTPVPESVNMLCWEAIAC